MSTDASEDPVFSEENQPSKAGVANHNCNPSTLEAGGGGGELASSRLAQAIQRGPIT